MKRSKSMFFFFLGEFTLLLFHSWEFQEHNSLTSANFNLKLLYTYQLYLDKKYVTRYKFMLLLRVSLRLGAS